MSEYTIIKKYYNDVNRRFPCETKIDLYKNLIEKDSVYYFRLIRKNGNVLKNMSVYKGNFEFVSESIKD